MKLCKSLIFVLLSILFLFNTGFSQVQKCATWEAEQAFRMLHPEIGTKQDFENWMSIKISSNERHQGESIQVPVVFHVIHDGTAVGNGDNIAQSQIIAQVEQLNNDFGRIDGTSGDNDHPDGTETDIQFCLASVDENGEVLQEPGINRINCNTVGWNCPPYEPISSNNPNTYLETTVKPQSQWDPEIYLNIWVCGLTGGALGYAQFPIQSGLPGLNDNLGADTDGVVIEPNTVGSTTQPANGTGPYRMGRTATHEVGHFFGLRHIWGDGGCGVDDFCDDTPESDAPNFGCQTGHTSCGSTDMVRNYMDYSDDDCMNIFTNDQEYRFDVVLENSPRRSFDINLCNIENCEPIADQHIDQNTTWTSSNIPFGGQNMGYIYVKPGATLTIDAPISFAEGSKLFAYAGSKVVLNSTLTSCDTWGGVRVFGNEEHGPGEFESNEGALIENAHWGISSTDWGDYLGRGIVDCEGTTFKNNSTAVMIATKNGYEIEQYPYDATFIDCDFNNDNNNRFSKFWVFIASRNIRGSSQNPSGVVVDNCTFIDEQTNSNYPTIWNSGVNPFNSDVVVSNCSFENMYTGVFTHETYGINPLLKVEESTFQDCTYGLVNTGTSSAVIRNNDFYLGHTFTPSPDGDQVGVILQGLINDIYLQENSFDFSPGNLGGNVVTKGVYTNSIGTFNNKIRKNTYTDLDYANIARGKNSDLKRGLHYLCNQNNANETVDFIAFDGPAIRIEQGLAKDIGFLPAGNTFSHTSTPIFWDFNNESTFTGNPYDASYYYDPTDPDQEPLDYTQLVLKNAGPSDYCTEPEIRENLTTPEEAAQNEQDYLDYLEDYEAAVQAFDSTLNYGDSAQIASAKATLIYETERLQKTVTLGYRYAQYVLRDRAASRKWMARFDNQAGDYLLVGDHFAHGEYTQGLAELDSIPLERDLTEAEHTDHARIYSMYEEIAINGVDSFSESFVDELMSYASSYQGRSCWFARTLLVNEGIYFDPITDVPSEEAQKEIAEDKDVRSPVVYPNPSTGMITFSFDQFVNDKTDEVKIDIFDQLGRRITTLTPPQNDNQIEWFTNKVRSGLYFYNISVDGQQADSGQFVIIE